MKIPAISILVQLQAAMKQSPSPRCLEDRRHLMKSSAGAIVDVSLNSLTNLLGMGDFSDAGRDARQSHQV